MQPALLSVDQSLSNQIQSILTRIKGFEDGLVKNSSANDDIKKEINDQLVSLEQKFRMATADNVSRNDLDEVQHELTKKITSF